MKTITIMLTAAAAVALVAAPASAGLYSDAVLGDNPVGYWRLSDTGGTAVDATSNGHDGAYLNGVVQGVPGAIFGDPDTAANFDGSNDKIDVPYSSALNPNTYSFETWARIAPGSGTGYRSPMTSRNGSPQEGYIFYAEGGQWQYWTGPGWHVVDAPVGSAVEGEWAHLVGTYDAGTQQKDFYLNGHRVASVSGVTANPNSAQPLRFGAGATEGSGAYFFRGDVDEPAVYGSVLSSEQVRHHYVAAQANFLNFHDFANPGGVGLGPDASAMTFAGRTSASPTRTNPDGTLVLGGSGTGGLVFTQDLPKALNFVKPLVIETEAFYTLGDAPPSQSNAYMGLKALHLMGTSTTTPLNRGGLWAQFQPYTSGSAHMRIGFQGAAPSGTDVWYDNAASQTVSGFADANGLFHMQLSIAGLDDDDPLTFTVTQDTWTSQLGTTIGGYRNALPSAAQQAFDQVLSELRAEPWRMDYGLISTSARADGYNYLAIYGTLPEPSTCVLLVLGGVGLLATARRRRRT